MKRVGQAAIVWIGLGTLITGCSGEASLAARDAAIAGLATFIEQTTLEILNNTFPGPGTEE